MIDNNAHAMCMLCVCSLMGMLYRAERGLLFVTYSRASPEPQYGNKSVVPRFFVPCKFAVSGLHRQISNSMREEEVKNKLRQDFFQDYDATPILGDIDFAVTIKST